VSPSHGLHPCHHDQNAEGNRVIHSCGAEKPFLGFSYTAEKQLQCGCLEHVATGSVYIGRELCAGHTCEDGKNLLLDYDERTDECVCSGHPCLNDNGKEHRCSNEGFPILSYHYDESGKLVCRCSKDYKAKEDL